MVGSSGGHGDHIAPTGGIRQMHIRLNDVPAFTAAADDIRNQIVFLRDPAGVVDGIRCLIQGVAEIVRHAAVDGDIALVAGDAIHGADMV